MFTPRYLKLLMGDVRDVRAERTCQTSVNDLYFVGHVYTYIYIKI